MKRVVYLLFAAGLFTGLSAADENVLKTHAELGYTNTAGNTESQDLAGNLKMDYTLFSNGLRFVGNVLYSANKNFDTNETAATKSRWDAELNYDYNFNKRWAFNYLAGGKGDKFSTYVYQAYTGPGAIWKAVKSDWNDLKLQANLLWSWDKYRDETLTDKNPNQYASWQVSLDYTYKISETSRFIQYLMYRSEFADTANYFAKSKTAVESKINGYLSLGVSYTVDYTNDKADNIRSYSDRVLLAALIADF
ncbi:MAG: DUF481 domain-containing protein [Thiovulaceae bacterium]|nr:DUF481 domain-containing protein [Sulfurimonadaceae bacterium]